MSLGSVAFEGICDLSARLIMGAAEPGADNALRRLVDDVQLPLDRIILAPACSRDTAAGSIDHTALPSLRISNQSRSL